MLQITKNRIIEYAKKYDKCHKGTDDELVEQDIKEWFKNNRYLDRKRFIKVGLWKSKRPRKRYKNNNDSLVKEITRFSLKTKNEEAKIKSLLIFDGVSYPLASVILHFAYPNKYPILDFRVIWSLGWKQPKCYTFDFWNKYCKIIKNISKKTGENLRTIDKAFWKYSKQNQNK